ncbi:RNA methyltransferase [Streptomyces alanosinicus]|uniref:rRNA methyltransferase n=1 Tax=Streptomyces alanosinicus TaxID=68171 RepID=A0A919D4I7_9ACTN|nr:RNA methyltransferase [Streptomyces alanosinicus]GHE06677.1 rRNA methyltransferase [Streptomyces alanosinicus]
MEISSPSNPRIKELVTLRRRRSRHGSGVTLVEGYEELDLALRAGVRPRDLYFCPALTGGKDPRNVLARSAELGTALFSLSQQAFDKAAYREGPDGWLAVVPSIETELSHIDVGPQALILVCEGVEKPGNLGSMLRTADAAGVTAVVSADAVTDWGNPNVIRASKGTVFSVPVASAASDEVMDWLAKNSVRVVAATPDTDVLMTEFDMTGPTAIAVGSEKYGLSDAWMTGAHSRAKIPMFGQVDSLNVAVSAALFTYEAVRQRMAAGQP